MTWQLPAAAPMPPLPKRRIAAHYLPSRPHYWYALTKLATDPVYAEVRQVFSQAPAALLDVGCGIGLLPQCLRGSGVAVEYLGLDVDATKIEIARTAAAAGGLSHVAFEIRDLLQGLPAHRGSVALLDVLQYFERQEWHELLSNAARCVTRDGRLILRTGLDDGGWRAALTRAADQVGHALRWMKTPPRSQPALAELQQLLVQHGLRGEFKPLWGWTPFNNWLVVATRVPP